MKNYALFFVAIACAFSLNSFAQSSPMDSMSDNNDLAVVSYHVEERINMNFGSRITTYNVPTLSLVNKEELGENNIRIITPKYAKIRAKIMALQVTGNKEAKLASVNITSEQVDKEIIATAPRKRQFVDIDVVDTYQRVINKGYKSIPMITKVADRHFFDGDLELAAKWYGELFAAKSDLEAVYYFRYAQALKAVNQPEKAAEMMKIFESKSL
ncbi:hypothetical protein [Flavobacterium sp.]